MITVNRDKIISSFLTLFKFRVLHKFRYCVNLGYYINLRFTKIELILVYLVYQFASSFKNEMNLLAEI